MGERNSLMFAAGTPRPRSHAASLAASSAGPGRLPPTPNSSIPTRSATTLPGSGWKTIDEGLDRAPYHGVAPVGAVGRGKRLSAGDGQIVDSLIGKHLTPHV